MPKGLEVFDAIELKLRIAWPQSIVFTNDIMKLYSKIMNFMLKIKRVRCALHSLFFLLKSEHVHYEVASLFFDGFLASFFDIQSNPRRNWVRKMFALFTA